MLDCILPDFRPIGMSLLSGYCYSRGITHFHGWPNGALQESILVKIVLRERETVQEAVRRLRKILERSGLKRELRQRERYEKPSDVKRKAKNRAIRRAKRLRQSG